MLTTIDSNIIGMDAHPSDLIYHQQNNFKFNSISQKPSVYRENVVRKQIYFQLASTVSVTTVSMSVTTIATVSTVIVSAAAFRAGAVWAAGALFTAGASL